MRPDLGGDVFNRQRDKKSRMDNGKREREFTSGEKVLVQNFRGKPKWLDGATVAEQTALSALESSRQRSTVKVPR